MGTLMLKVFSWLVLLWSSLPCQAVGSWQAAWSHTSGLGCNEHPCFTTGSWSPCSVSCGEGVRSRPVSCTLYLSFSGTSAILPDRQCPGPRPQETEVCVERQHCWQEKEKEQEQEQDKMIADTITQVRDSRAHGTRAGKKGPQLLTRTGSQATAPVATTASPLPLASTAPLPLLYTWAEAGFGPCSASCLGGLQGATVICVEAGKNVSMMALFCDPHKKPKSSVRACNSIPCPPRWDISDFSDCTKSCGGGVQTRDVNCVQEVSHGANNSISLPETSCLQPPPRFQRICGVTDCPVQWLAAPWSKCSQKCGLGWKRRRVECKQLLSLGQVTDQPEGQCRGDKPVMQEDCKIKECRDKIPEIKASLNQDYSQAEPGLKVLKLKVGGRASVYAGTTLKLHCPVRNFVKTSIVWEMGGLEIPSSQRSVRHNKVSVSHKGVLKIKNIGFENAGVYTCIAAKAKANLEVNVKEIEASQSFTRASSAEKKRTFALRKHRQTVNETRSHMTTTYKSLPSKRRIKFGGRDGKSVASGGADGGKYNITGYMDDQSISIVPRAQQPASRPRGRVKKKQMKRRKTRKEAFSERTLSWSPGAWSSCSRPCEGKRRRPVTCSLHVSVTNITKQVSGRLCRRGELQRPPRLEQCGGELCPTWWSGDWLEGECREGGAGVRTRAVVCIQEGQVVLAALCSSQERPGDSQSYEDTACRGAWRVGEWSPCSTSCGRGSQERSVSCSWPGGGTAPPEECSGQGARPQDSRACAGPPCTGECAGPPCTGEPTGRVPRSRENRETVQGRHQVLRPHQGQQGGQV